MCRSMVKTKQEQKQKQKQHAGQNKQHKVFAQNKNLKRRNNFVYVPRQEEATSGACSSFSPDSRLGRFISFGAVDVEKYLLKGCFASASGRERCFFKGSFTSHSSISGM